MKAPHIILTTILALTLLGSCTTTVRPSAGSPNPVSLRPRTIRLDSIDPCSLLTSEQLKALSIGHMTSPAAQGNRGPVCRWSHAFSEPFEGYLIETHTMDGIEAALDNPLGIEHTTVLDYPALEATGQHADPKTSCGVLVDVAPGQTLNTSYFYDGRTVPMNHEIACTKAKAAAEMAMQTLIQKSG